MEQERDNHIQQALEKQRQELAAQTQAAHQKLQQEITRQFDEQRGEWKRQKEGHPLRLDSLTGERDGTQQLLEAGEKSQRKEANANMENKLNAMSKKKSRNSRYAWDFGLWLIMLFVPSYNCLCLARSTEKSK